MVQRYEATTEWGEAVMSEYDFGDYVAYEDYQKLEAELEQLRQQVEVPTDDGWIEWKGGECPLSGETKFTIKFRSGQVYIDSSGSPEWWDWSHTDSYGDIVAYRILEQSGC